MLSPSALFCLRHFRAVLISMVVKSPERSLSAVGVQWEISHPRRDASVKYLASIMESPIADNMSDNGVCC